MIKKEIKRKKNSSLVKVNMALNPSNNKYAIINSKKNEQKNPKKKIIKKKARAHSTSSTSKGEPKKEIIIMHQSFNNSLELDYLNFSQIDLFKLNGSFEEDIFNPNYISNNQKNKKKLILNRYEDSNSTIKENSNIIPDSDEFENEEKVKDKKELLNTPSTICNYYEKSNKKNLLNNQEIEKNNEIKKNLELYYIDNNVKYKDIKSKEKENYTLNNNIKSKNDLNKNNLIKEKNSSLMKEIIFPENLKKNENSILSNNCKNTNSIIPNYSNNYKINKNKKNVIYDKIKKIDLKPVEKKINANLINIINEKKQIRKGSQEKAINIYNNQNKNDGYYITPRNAKKIQNENSTKSTKINTQSIGKAKSFSSKKIKTKHINNNLNYLNKHNINNKITNYKIIKDLIKDNKDIINNKNQLNKTTSKNKYSNLNIKKNSNCLIKVNIKNKTKSSSHLNTFKKQKKSEENKIFNALNNNINNKIKSEIKNSFIFENLYKTINKSGIKSPDKDDTNNLFKISKTLTENNVIYKIQATPKNYKIQKFDSIPFTTIVKKIFIGSSQKENLIKFDSSKKNNEKTKTNQMKCIFKPKTQIDFKPYNNILGNEFFKKSGNNGINCDYGNDKHVKQKLLDRMNKATNNWHYIFKGKKNKKVMDDGLSNLKSQNKEHYNYFYKNENIISDGSEKEDEDNV